MKRKWPLLIAVCVFLFGNFQVYSASPPRDKAHQLAQTASQIKAEQCNGAARTMEDCHGFFASGCTAAGHYDAYLSYLKNQRPSPLVHTSCLLTVDDFDDKESEIPDGLIH
jgi:hypothetical protein